MDLISRQDAIDALNDEFTIMGKINAIVVQSYIQRVNNRLHNLPSAQDALESAYQEGYTNAESKYREFLPKKGEWIQNYTFSQKCNLCGFSIHDWDWHRFNYCPNCGARMLRGEEA